MKWRGRDRVAFSLLLAAVAAVALFDVGRLEARSAPAPAPAPAISYRPGAVCPSPPPGAVLLTCGVTR